MSVQYRAISWNPFKRKYDAVAATVLILYLALFVGLGAFWFPFATAETLLIRGFGTAAMLLLHIILCIGPLCRLNKSFLPLLYNRRHLGVMMFFLALAHGAFGIIQFHSNGVIHPLVSVLATNRSWESIPDFPFQQLGFGALVILFLMAATSHDFWLRNLTPPVWKRLHMLIYAAYALLVGHIALGALQTQTSWVYCAILAAGFGTVIGLHLAAAHKEQTVDRRKRNPQRDGFIEVCAVSEIAENCATVFSANGERIAVFRYDGKISALSNVCRHQNGPLGEGKIIDGCVTCPWHGYQYAPASGSAPPPFTEKVSTFRTRVVADRVWIDPKPNPPGTQIEPSRIVMSPRGASA